MVMSIFLILTQMAIQQVPPVLEDRADIFCKFMNNFVFHSKILTFAPH